LLVLRLHKNQSGKEGQASNEVTINMPIFQNTCRYYSSLLKIILENPGLMRIGKWSVECRERKLVFNARWGI
jgi:hypothetical protein